MRIISLIAVTALATAGAGGAAKPMSPDMPAKPEQTLAPAAPARADSTTAPAKPVTIADVVTADWPKYDLGAKGHLSQAEFDKWLTDLRVAANQSAPDAAWLKQAFTQTDTDKDTKITSAELTKFLSAGG
jgi:hypothetical protein